MEDKLELATREHNNDGLLKRRTTENVITRTYRNRKSDKKTMHSGTFQLARKKTDFESLLAFLKSLLFNCWVVSFDKLSYLKTNYVYLHLTDLKYHFAAFLRTVIWT